LIPADGFYEWQRQGRGKIPYWFHRPARKHFAFAGLWEPGLEDNQTTCTIVTTTANAVVSGIHDRMPVMLTEKNYDRWLYGQITEMAGLLVPFSVDDLLAERVSTRVNSVSVDDEMCVQPERNLLE